MKQVLIIAPDFIPSSYPPALRIKNFVKHFPEFGWQPTVITVEPKYYEWEVDLENQQLLPEGLDIVRTQALPAAWTRKIGFGDIGLRSLWHQWRAAVRLCEENKIDLVFISLPPCFPAVLARLIHDTFGIPYVIDYIDPWVYGDYWNRPRSQRSFKRTFSHILSCFLEPYVLRKVARITGVSKATCDNVISRYPWLRHMETSEIPYGGDPQDFEYLKENPRKNKIFDRDDGNIHISYVGRGGIDLEPAIASIFEALRAGFKSFPSLFSQIRLHFVGTSYSPVKVSRDTSNILLMAKKMGLENFVDETPSRLLYLDALQTLLDSHALLAIGSNRPHYTASKIFPYILAGKPLLTVFHEASNVVKILQETGAAHLVTFNEENLPIKQAEKIMGYLKQIISQSRDYSFKIDWKAFEPYTARSMTRRLAEVFDAVCSSETILVPN